MPRGCWLFDELHRHTGDPQHLATARRALGWPLDQQYFGDDPRAQDGLVAVSPHSAFGIRPWFRVSSTYGTAFLGLALLEELRLQQAGPKAGHAASSPTHPDRKPTINRCPA